MKLHYAIMVLAVAIVPTIGHAASTPRIEGKQMMNTGNFTQRQVYRGENSVQGPYQRCKRTIQGYEICD